jgi:CHAT domain-containing protein
MIRTLAQSDQLATVKQRFDPSTILPFLICLLLVSGGSALAQQDDGLFQKKIAELNSKAMKCSLSGRRNKAIEYYEQALAIAEAQGKKHMIPTQLQMIGSVYWGAGRYDKAVEYYEKALTIQKELGSREIKRTLYSLGGLYHAWCNVDKTKCAKAIEYYKKAGGPLCLNSIGQVYYSLGMVHGETANLEKAIACYKQALEKSPSQFHEVIAGNIAEAYYALEKYDSAIQYLEKSVDLKEEQRLTGRGRPDVALITSYMLLTSAYIRENRPDMAFDTVEQKTARHLSEQLGKGESSFAGIKKYQEKMDPGTAVINYTYIRNPLGYQFNTKKVEPVQIVVDSKSINGYELSKYKTVESIKQDEPLVTSFLREIRRVNVKSDIRPMDERERRDDVIRPKNKQELYKLFKQTEFSMLDFNIGEVLSEYEFDAIVIYYRHLLTEPYLSKSDRRACDLIGKRLYNFLFGQIERHLADKTELIIIPDGILSFLPFETLIMPDGRYLVEKYNIKYLQSLTVEESISKRNYSKERKPLLAFGGAVYDNISYDADMITSKRQLEQLQKNTLLAMSRGKSVSKFYGSLGFGSWNNLPGTLTEVKALKGIIPSADIYTGDKVSEPHIKKLSKDGRLKQYKVLHFATHGIVVPEVPELSALVLSQFRKEKGGEDGYLNMREIASLDIQADFINLSSCKTGLGKIYRGEGLAGLTQSFLIAGANALSVSLWQVSDESTMEFMVGMYRLVRGNGMSYDRAITEMKRRFIRGAVDITANEGSRGLVVKTEGKRPGGKYSDPFFWAPFVYYGK